MKQKYGTNLRNPLIITEKNDSIKIVLDARHPSSNTGQSTEYWPLEPSANSLVGQKKYKTLIDQIHAFAHATLDDETLKVTVFSPGDTLFAFITKFLGLKVLLKIFPQQMSTSFKDLIQQGSALLYNDDIVLVSTSKPYVLQIIKKLNDIANK